MRRWLLGEFGVYGLGQEAGGPAHPRAGNRQETLGPDVYPAVADRRHARQAVPSPADGVVAVGRAGRGHVDDHDRRPQRDHLRRADRGPVGPAGAENAYPDRADWPTLGPQQVVALAPEVVIVNAAGPGPPDRLEVIRRGWAALESVPAVRRGRVHILTDAYLSIPGPRVGLAARRLAETIHPELAGAWTASAAPSPGPEEARP